MLYLDNNATTRPTPAVIDAVRRALEELWHNPSSLHRPGQAARQAVELARKDIAALIGVHPRELVFMSGGTESIHTAIRGTFAAHRSSSRRAIVTTRVEHSAVRSAAEIAAREHGGEVRWAPLAPGGFVDVDALTRLIDDDVLMVSVQWANNETGIIQPIERIGELCRARGVVFHTDATQWVGKMPVDLGTSGSAAPEPRLPIDLLTFAPHKFHGPKGVGVLWIRRGTRVVPMFPGSQELERRAGTENVPGILGAAAACVEAAEWLNDPSRRGAGSALRDRLEAGVLARCPGCEVNTPRGAERLWNTTSLSFAPLQSEPLLILLSESGLCASAGSSCASGSVEPSPILTAMGLSSDAARGSIRLSTCRFTVPDEGERAVELVGRAWDRLGSGPGPGLLAGAGGRG